MRRAVMRAACALLIAAAAVFPSLAGGVERWVRYTNDRYGTSVEVPSSFVMRRAPANDDGRSFGSADGLAELAVYADYAPITVVSSFEAYRAWTRAEEVKAGTTLTYDAAGRNWFALSGMRGGQIVYLKVVASCPDLSLAHHLRVEYPASAKATFDPIVARAATSLRHAGRIGC